MHPQKGQIVKVYHITIFNDDKGTQIEVSDVIPDDKINDVCVQIASGLNYNATIRCEPIYDREIQSLLN